MKISARAAIGAASLMLLVTGCGRSDESEKSITDVTDSVHAIAGVLEDEQKAVKRGDARDEVEITQVISTSEAAKLSRYADRAPADTADFADAALEWAQALAKSRTELLTKSDPSGDMGALLMVQVNHKAKALNEAAESLDVDGWEPVETF